MWVLKFTCISYLNWCFQVAFVSKLCFQVRFYRLVRQTLPINNPRGSFEIVPTCDITLIQLYNNQMMLSFLIILHLVVSHQWHQDRCCNKLLLLPDCPAVRWTQIGLTWFWIKTFLELYTSLLFNGDSLKSCTEDLVRLGRSLRRGVADGDG